MASVVEMQYNPYIPRLRILINGKQPPDFSRLIQYVDEGIWCWAATILDTIYAELMDDFSLIFTGTELDAEVMKQLCMQKAYCKSFSSENFVVREPLQLRMQKLNGFIKRDKITEYKKTEIEAFFVLESRMQELQSMIPRIDIHNFFCSVKTSVINKCTDYREEKNSVLFLIADDESDAKRHIEQLHTERPCYVILTGETTKLLEVTTGAWFFEAAKEALMDTIFSCFLQEPLLRAFQSCIRSIMAIERNRNELQRLISVDPVINIAIEEKIEAGKSVRIQISSESGISIPKLLFRIPEEKIAYCNDLCVFGVKEGPATFEAYLYGEKQPIYVKSFEVIKRNRITELLLSEDNLLLGIGDRKKLSCSYFPENADNADCITWVSSDESVVKAEENGNLTAVGKGDCRIICMAENISVKCLCKVKPYLQEIEIVTPLDNNRLYMQPMEERKLQLRRIPEDCYDGKLSTMSADSNIVNVIGDNLYAKNTGCTILTIRNASGSISHKIEVVVGKSFQKKGGFIESLFRKISRKEKKNE